VTAGIDAIGEVTIRLQHEGRIYSGHSANTDIIVASAQAYLNALNRLVNALQNPSQNPQSFQDKTTQPVAHL
jgi:2-isopropylmalate synthase